MATVTLDNIKKSYGEREVVHGVSCDVADGELVVVVGPSGCGKSTLLRMVAGLEDITSGAVAIDGRVVNGVEPKDRDIAMVFQNYALYPHMSCFDNMAYGLRMRGMARDEIRVRVDRAAAILQLDGLLDRKPRQLSGGQRQRVAIARALVLRPRVVICDEPTSALDVSVQAQIVNLLAELRRDFGLTYIVISHNLAVVEHICDEVAVMYLGRIVERAATDALFRAPTHPYTRALLASVLTPEPGLGIPDVGLGESYPDPANVPPGCRFHPRCPVAFDRCRTDVPEGIVRDGRLTECLRAAVS